MAAARKKAASTNNSTPIELTASSTFPPGLATIRAVVHPGSAIRQATRSTEASRSPRPPTDNASRAEPTAAARPPGRSAGHTDRTANQIVAAPQSVSTTTRNTACGAVTAYISLMECFTTL